MKKIIFITAFFITTVNSAFSQDAVESETNKMTPNFVECVAVRMREITLRHLATNNPRYTTRIPAGWTVVSGTGGEGYPKIILCR